MLITPEPDNVTPEPDNVTPESHNVTPDLIRGPFFKDHEQSTKHE